MVCDICNAPVTPLVATAFTPDEFRQIVRQGFGPSLAALMYAKLMGIDEEQFVRGWKNDIVERSTTPWLLCPSCAERARAFLPVGLVR